LADFAKLVELFDKHNVSFVSVTQQFNTTTSMGRLTLNVLLSFAQFEREVTSERIGDKIAASKRKGQLPGALRVGSKGEMTAIPLIVWSSPNRRHQTRVGIRQPAARNRHSDDLDGNPG
jgi:site-specific DNA recombinase